jgi:hypothetical protein
MFRAICSAMILFILALPVRAAEEAKPNTLTAKEIEEGWILLFDGETTFGWAGKDRDAATVDKDDVVLGDNYAGPFRDTTAWNTYELHFEYSIPKGGKGWIVLGGDVNGKESVNDLPLDLIEQEGAWREMKVIVKPGNVAYEQYPLDRKLKTGEKGLLFRELPAGTIALQGARARFRNIKLKPLDTKPLFNGKDLTGWKKFDADPKKAKSEFSVAKEGWIHLKDGPGDLQTEKEWGDFILQIECFSNGDKLNSGVFFRCRPNEYQNGYEAQIHNGFTVKPEKEYAIEEFDSETHKLTGTKKEKFQAMDYGTGGIYRRIPARRSVAKDKEWFTMTVAAQGRHIATWVNGIQVVDWTDNRPEADNARNGCRLGKGPISLQGHDATTDLRFRNINIVELPAGEGKKEK